ncbi:MAG: pilus assembly protein [Litorimonas sp.]
MTNRKDKTLLRRFKASENGNVAAMTAISLLVLMGVAALAVDLSTGFNNKSRLSDASDSVALMLAKSELEREPEMRRAAENWLEEKYPGEVGAGLTIVDIQRNGDEVTVQLANEGETYFAAVLGKTDLDVAASSSAVWSQRSMDIALVLDTTLSMEGTRLASLKTAATDMIDTIDGFDNDKVKMSVVPFSNYVNVGLSRRNATWLSVPADSSKTENVCRKKRDVLSKSNPRKISRTCDRDGRQVDCSYTKWDKTYGPEYEVCGPKTSRQTWHGCVGSRSEPWDTRVAYNGRKIPGLLNARCGAELQEMSSDLSAARSTIQSLRASGNTYMPSGLMWGWRTLNGSAPLSRTVDPKVEKVMILMTDGDNTRFKGGDRHEVRNRNEDANDKTQDICDAVKAEDILIYTIAYEVTDADTKTLLKNCSSGRSYAYDATNASELSQAFEDIANSLNELRISA